jgi:hypothetical protein
MWLVPGTTVFASSLDMAVRSWLLLFCPPALANESTMIFLGGYTRKSGGTFTSSFYSTDLLQGLSFIQQGIQYPYERFVLAGYAVESP